MKPEIRSALTAKIDFNPRIGHVIIVALLTVVLQMTLNCLCAEGPIQVRFAAMLDLIIFPRMLIAALFREKGGWFKVYSIIMLTSFLWIEWLVHWLA